MRSTRWFREGRTVLCYKTVSVPENTQNKTANHVRLSVIESLQCRLVSVCCVCVCFCMCTPTVLHTLLAAALHRLLHVLRERGPVVAFEGEPPASDPQGGAAGGGGGARLGAGLAPAPTFDPGERLGRLAEDGAALKPVVISHRLTSTRGLCGRRHTGRIKRQPGLSR